MKKILILFGLLGFFFLPELSAQFLDEKPTTGIYAENSTGVKKPIPLPSIRESDVMWKKTVWREIDFRQKMNQGFYFPVTQQGNWKNLITILLDGVKSGEITAYDAKDDGKGDLSVPVTYDKIYEQHTREDIKYITTEDGVEQKVIREEINVANVTRCRIKETWYFDKQRSQLMVRILAICPIEMREDNEKMVPYTLFWIPFNDETRQLLVQQPFHNRSNTGAQLNYDEVFMKRMFDSYIIREENVYDRAIVEYAQGIDALHESERIKNSIIEFEQNLWEY